MVTHGFSIDFNHYGPYLKAFALKLTNDHHQAEDLFQDTALLAFRHQEKFQVGTNLKAWLSTIMKNTFINHYRKKQRHGLVFDGSKEQSLLDSGKVSIFNDGESNLTVEELETMINGLNEPIKKPFTMANSGYKYEEIAETMNLPLGTVKSRIFMARKALQKQLELSQRLVGRYEMAAA